MKLLSAVSMLLTMAACNACSHNPDPNPTPTPTPLAGYDCGAQPILRGVVPVQQAQAGKYIVIYKQRAGARIQSLMTAEGVSEAKQIRQGIAARFTALALQRVLSDPNVEYVQEDGIKSVPEPGKGSPGFRAAAGPASWGLDRVDQRDLPLDGSYQPGDDGTGVNIAIVDTGVTPNPDFGTRLVLGDCFTAHEGKCTDGHGHGTHVAGTAAGDAYGIAKGATLWAVRVLDSNGSGSDSDVIRGIEWVTAKKESDPTKDWVINMSLGGGDSPALNRATCTAIAAGVVVAAAAGNEGVDADTSSPARVRQAITVLASDKADRMAGFSNYGPIVDIGAPGVDITSDQPDGSTATWSGTSMATPHVTGAIALTLQRQPLLKPADVEALLTLKATPGKLSALGPGSPNLLLYVKAE